MSFITGRELVPARLVIERGLAFVLASSLFVAAGTHVVVAIEHGSLVFAWLAIAAALAQCLLAAAVLLRPSPFVYQSSIFLSLMLMQLYVLNVTVGLPPLITHTHLEGTHTLFGIALTWPNRVDAQGVVAQSAQLATVFSAAFLDNPD